EAPAVVEAGIEAAEVEETEEQGDEEAEAEAGEAPETAPPAAVAQRADASGSDIDVRNPVPNPVAQESMVALVAAEVMVEEVSVDDLPGPAAIEPDATSPPAASADTRTPHGHLHRTAPGFRMLAESDDEDDHFEDENTDEVLRSDLAPRRGMSSPPHSPGPTESRDGSLRPSARPGASAAGSGPDGKRVQATHAITEPVAEMPSNPARPTQDATLPSAEFTAALRRAEEAATRREAARVVAEYDDDELRVSHPPRNESFDFDERGEQEDGAMVQEQERLRGIGPEQPPSSAPLLDVGDPVNADPAGDTDRPARTVDNSRPEPGAVADTRAEPVDASFSAPRLALADVDRKLRVAVDVLSHLSHALDTHLGPGAGQASVQLLLEGAPSTFAVVFQGLEAARDGTFDVGSAAQNIQRRPKGEHRRLVDNGTLDLIERGLSYAVAELDDDSMDALLAKIAGYQQRLRT
ncbi:MAG: hypothetical protein VX000_03160, partial [Myxococcota bacterium]|nr:hypothetical protein [Myxococcota bacterium]